MATKTNKTKPTAKAKERILVKTAVGRMLRPCLLEPEPETAEYDAGKYHVTLMISKEDWKNNPVCKEMREQVLKAGRAYFGDQSITLKDFQHPFGDGDTKAQDYFKGMIVINSKSEYKPKLIGPDKVDLAPEVAATIKGGDYGRLVCNAYGYTVKGNTGIALGLQVVQFARPGEALGGGAAAALELLDEMEVALDDIDEEETGVDGVEVEEEEEDDGVIV